MNSWLLRPNPIQKDRMQIFLSDDIVAIGWPRLPDLTNKNRDDIKHLLLKAYPEKYAPNSTNLGNVATVIDSFSNQFEHGDFVVVPHGDDIYIGRIDGDYYYDESKANDIDGYPHQRKVQWLFGPISRDKIPTDLRSSLRAQMTIVNLKHRQNLIEQLLGVTEQSQALEPIEISDVDSLMADALKILKAELASEDADRRLKAAVEIIRLKQDERIDK